MSSGDREQGVRLVGNEPVVRTRRSEPSIESASNDTTGNIPFSVDAGSTTTSSEPGSEFLPSPSSDEPSNVSIVRYRTPRNVRQFASQANLVATAILNGKIDLETARAYSSVARTVAQAITAETTRARFLKTAPDLDFDTEEE